MKNDKLVKLLNELDNSCEKNSEDLIFSKISNVTKEDESTESVAERNAFTFCEDYHDKENWGTYYGPMIVWPDGNGNIRESPGRSCITKDVIKYWTERSQNTKNLLMKSRYAGLVWDFSETAIGKKADYQIAIDYINALIDVVDNDLCDRPTDAKTKIIRAYNVAMGLNQSDLIKRCIESTINLEDRVAEDDKPGLWGFSFNLFILGKCKNLSNVQEKKLIQDLESRLGRVSKGHSPRVCESAGILLATYYRSKRIDSEVTRVIEIVGDCFEKSCEGLSPMQILSWLQHTHDIYINYNMNDNAERISKKISEIGPKVADSMQTISHSVKIPKEKLKSYLDFMTSGDLNHTLNRIAVQFIPVKSQVEQQVLDLVKDHPISYLFATTIQDHEGVPVAVIDRIEDDLEDNVIHQMSQNMNFDSFWLRHSLKKASEVYGLSAQDITDFVFNSPIFEESKKDIIQKGIEAFLSKDYISAIHILIPQIEAALRTLVGLMGGATLIKNRHGGLNRKTVGDLLRDERIKNCFGDDVYFYFRILLTDQRGWNIRNYVCHGINPSIAFNYSTADRVLHVILCLAQVREIND